MRQGVQDGSSEYLRLSRGIGMAGIAKNARAFQYGGGKRGERACGYLGIAQAFKSHRSHQVAGGTKLTGENSGDGIIPVLPRDVSRPSPIGKTSAGIAIAVKFGIHPIV